MDKQTLYEFFGFTLAFLGIGIAYYAVHFGMRLERYKRELEHEVRMRALELGRPFPGEGAWHTPGRLGLLTAVFVPVGVFGIAAVIASAGVPYNDLIWQGATMVAVTAVICGSCLSMASIKKAPENLPAREALARKPAVEDDAYDVVSSRG